jgi:hypothetical protein
MQTQVNATKKQGLMGAVPTVVYHAAVERQEPTDNYCTRQNSTSIVTHRLAPPVLGIRVKDELTIIGEGQVKDKYEYKDRKNRQPLQPRSAAGTWMVRGESEEDQQENEHHLEFLTEDHGCSSVFIKKRKRKEM